MENLFSFHFGINPAIDLENTRKFNYSVMLFYKNIIHQAYSYLFYGFVFDNLFFLLFFYFFRIFFQKVDFFFIFLLLFIHKSRFFNYFLRN